MIRALPALLLLAACGPSAATPTRGVFRFTPKAEDDRAGPVGTGLNRCELYIYTWADDGHCKVQLNHCALTSASSSELTCLSLADEHTIACGAQFNACGQQAECVCPVGPAAPVPDAPGTIHVTPRPLGQSFHTPDSSCTATVSTLPGGAEGPPPAPCILSIHECSAPGACTDRTEMLSCGIRSTVCSRPVKCDCPPAAASDPNVQS